MKSQRLSYYFVLSAVFVLSACSNTEYGGGNSLPYIEKILSDTESKEYLQLSSFNSISSRGNIVVMDNADRALAFSDYFLTCDVFDNISGNDNPDMLPDFAGENVVEISDNGNTPYSNILPDRKAMRTATVKSVIATLDSVSSAKITVLSSPFMAEYGMSDVDTLLYATDCALLVVSPLRLIASQTRNLKGIAVFADSEAVGTDIYSQIFRDRNVFVYDCDSLPSMKSFLEQYMVENQDALDMVVIDNVNVDVNALSTELESFFDVENYDNLALRQMIGTEFRIVDVRDVAAREVYRLMRKGNLFTHAISYPEKIELRTDYIGDYSLYNVQD